MSKRNRAHDVRAALAGIAQLFGTEQILIYRKKILELSKHGNVHAREAGRLWSAALGAAIQAAWTIGRLKDPSLTAHDVARRFVGTPGEPTEPNRANETVYDEAKARLIEQTARLFT